MASSLPPRGPYVKKENLGTPRRGMGFKVASPRNVLSAINNGAANGGAPSAQADGGGSGAEAAPVVEFSGREDAERLLAEKMKGKSKNDFKGRVDQMSEYIKKLRACVRWYMELEDGYLAEQEKLRGAMDAENTRHTELEAKLSNAIEELKAANLDLTRRCDSLEESFNKEMSEKTIAVEYYEKEKKERESAETSRELLTVDLERVTHDAMRFSEQLKMVQDTNKRLQEYNASLQQYNSNLQADASKSGEAISKLQKEKSAMMETMAVLRECNSSMNNQLESSRVSQQDAIRVKEELRKEVECLRAELNQVRDDRDHSVVQLNNLNIELANYKERYGKSSMACESMSVKVSALEETCNTQQEQIQNFQKQLAVATEKLKLADVTAIEAMTGYEEQKEKIKYLEDRLAHAESQIIEGDKLRKKLHNTILELKGNIRVFCRVRPLLFDGNSNGSEEAFISYPTSVESAGRGIDLINQGQQLSFSYDKVFDHDASQEDVFVEISQLVQSALDGYRVCIFAYGQTGSGKTYTMMGKPGVDKKGIIPRSLEQIFKTSRSLESQGWKYSMQASMLEIYNETIRDLLAPDRSNSFEMTTSKQYSIKHDPHGNTTVSDLTVIDVFDIADVTSLLEKASKSRSVGRTQMNEQSSRSHFVFTLKISGSNENTCQQVQGVLNLIDLAGSERLAKSGSTGDRLKETQAINKSLSALSDVIFAIAKGDDHVPFRNSKLTYLLQPCLGGDSKTLMFVNISPEGSSVGETICSLRFASRVNACEIGIPRRHTQSRPLDSRLSYG
ncbi:kinesin-like protein KIN-14H isoform X2 [Phragmites australis]|uniref:kinesin-like protein KIN-14H isoform X2 n=1 Tax=Phragmites australis TaxID=29695 RepID=UPI002D79281C|nr:kinesin-like protein KIN-14H isoform X2 [Phragmites australis]